MKNFVYLILFLSIIATAVFIFATYKKVLKIEQQGNRIENQTGKLNYLLPE